MVDERNAKVSALNAVVEVGVDFLNFRDWGVLPSVVAVSEWAQDWQASWAAAEQARKADDPAGADGILADSIKRLDTLISAA